MVWLICTLPRSLSFYCAESEDELHTLVKRTWLEHNNLLVEGISILWFPVAFLVLRLDAVWIGFHIYIEGEYIFFFFLKIIYKKKPVHCVITKKFLEKSNLDMRN